MEQENKHDNYSDSHSYDPGLSVAIEKYHSPDPTINEELDEYFKGPDDIYNDNVDNNDYNKRAEVFDDREGDPLLWQSKCLERIKSERDVILSSPTGSGKTRVFLEWARDKKDKTEVDGRKHTVYITAPTKALSNQRAVVV